MGGDARWQFSKTAPADGLGLQGLSGGGHLPTAGDGLSQQVGGDVNGSDGHAIEGMGLGHDGRLVQLPWGLNRMKVSPYHIYVV